MALRLEKFDPSKGFVTACAFRAGGVAYGKGFPFPNDAVDQRTLQMLYEQRKVVYDDSFHAKTLLRSKHKDVELGKVMTEEQREAAMANADLASMSEDKLIARLVDSHTKAQLLEKAKGLGDVKSKDNKVQIATVLVRYGIVE